MISTACYKLLMIVFTTGLLRKIVSRFAMRQSTVIESMNIISCQR